MGGIPGMWTKREIGKNEQMESRQREMGRETERERRVDSDSSSLGHKPFFLRSLCSLPWSLTLHPQIKGSVKINKKPWWWFPTRAVNNCIARVHTKPQQKNSCLGFCCQHTWLANCLNASLATQLVHTTKREEKLFQSWILHSFTGSG